MEKEYVEWAVWVESSHNWRHSQQCGETRWSTNELYQNETRRRGEEEEEEEEEGESKYSLSLEAKESIKAGGGVV
jgi:hypothetical protein